MFTNETFDPMMAQNDSTAFIEFSRKVKSNILRFYRAKSYSLIKNIIIHSLQNGSVICNLTIFYNSSASDEVLLFQSAVEDAGMLGTMPVGKVVINSTDGKLYSTCKICKLLHKPPPLELVRVIGHCLEINPILSNHRWAFWYST